MRLQSHSEDNGYALTSSLLTVSSFPTTSFSFNGLYFSTLFRGKHGSMLTCLSQYIPHPTQEHPVQGPALLLLQPSVDVDRGKGVRDEGSNAWVSTTVGGTWIQFWAPGSGLTVMQVGGGR